MSAAKVIVHTDILVDYLLHRRRGESVLRLAMKKFFCYTTVFNAIELFSLARTRRELRAVEASMSAMKILGLNPKTARMHGALLAGHAGFPPMDLLVAGICLESGLPLLTGRHPAFRAVKGLTVIPARMVMAGGRGADILRAARGLRGNRQR